MTKVMRVATVQAHTAIWKHRKIRPLMTASGFTTEKLLNDRRHSTVTGELQAFELCAKNRRHFPNFIEE